MSTRVLTSLLPLAVSLVVTLAVSLAVTLAVSLAVTLAVLLAVTLAVLLAVTFAVTVAVTVAGSPSLCAGTTTSVALDEPHPIATHLLTHLQGDGTRLRNGPILIIYTKSVNMSFFPVDHNDDHSLYFHLQARFSIAFQKFQPLS